MYVYTEIRENLQGLVVFCILKLHLCNKLRVEVQNCTMDTFEGVGFSDVKSWHGLCLLLNMKVAISIWNGRVAPVFDVSERCLLISPDDDTTTSECVSFIGDSSGEKAQFLAEHQVHTVICGGISSEYEESLLAEDIEIVSFIAGPVDRVLEAWKKGTLVATDFSMPGCGCPRRRCRRRHRGGALRL